MEHFSDGAKNVNRQSIHAFKLHPEVINIIMKEKEEKKKKKKKRTSKRFIISP